MKEDFKVKDHSVSGEEFTLRYDANYNMYVTEPKPSADKLPLYYESEDYISHTDGKRSLFEIAYQVVKEITLSRKQKLLLKHHPKKGAVLDIGAGTGDFLEYLEKKGWETTGIEPNPKAQKLAQKKGLLLETDISDLSEKKFDVITMWHVLEHVYDLEGQIAWLKEHLQNNGTIFIAVPNFESYDANHYGIHWAGYDVPRHLYHFSKDAIERLFNEVGLTLCDVVPMKFDAFYVSLLSEKYRNGKMNFRKAILNGLRSNRKAENTGGYSSQIYVLKHA